jgi:excisionase family DNA binding protein
MTETPPQDEILLYPEAAALLRISERTLRRHVADGTVPHVRLGGMVRFSRNALLELVVAGTPAVAPSEKV